MSVTPTSDYISTTIDTIIRFSIHITSDKTINKFKITRDIVGTPLLSLLDTTISTQPFDFNFDYPINEDIPGSRMVMNFYCSDVSGNTFNVLRSVYISDFEYPLIETAGNTMYSGLSGKNCAYDLITGEQRSKNDPRPRDIEDNIIDTLSSHISRSWGSPDSLQFVVFNGFDYANATNRKAQSSFDAGVKQTVLNNLQEGDIIITKLNRSSYKNYFVVIKIVSIVDNDSTLNDYYLFNLKKK